MNASTTPAALAAAHWALDQPDSAQLLAGYHDRITSPGGYTSPSDYDAANDWLVTLHAKRTAEVPNAA